MKDMKTVASYICGRYEKQFGEKIDEMKLHKLMYFAQRESLMLTDKPLFDAEFQGWRYGPVLPALRGIYKNNDFACVTDDQMGDDKALMDTIFEEYAGSDSWSLSLLSHNEMCWKRSRKGVAPDANSKNPIPLDDIRMDAFRMKTRQMLLQNDQA